MQSLFLCLECGNSIHQGQCQSSVVNWKLFTEEQKHFIAQLRKDQFEYLARLKDPEWLYKTSINEVYDVPKFIHHNFVQSDYSTSQSTLKLELTTFGKIALQFAPS